MTIDAELFAEFHDCYIDLRDYEGKQFIGKGGHAHVWSAKVQLSGLL
jgi:hypothetical protein